MYDIAIIGSGPGGLSAAIYAARARLSTLVITGDEFGGQIASTHEVENYPGFDEGIMGPDLTRKMRAQAEKFGAEVVTDFITDLDVDGLPFTLTGRLGTYEARSVVVATGASPRKLDIPGEAEFIGRGVSYCATCDGAFFPDVPVAVVGGGDSALQEGLFLNRFASKITVIHRRDELRAGAYLQQRVFNEPKFEFLWDSVATEVVGEQGVQQLRLKNLKTGEESTLDVEGVFIFVGHEPNTEIFAGKLDSDERGYILADAHMRTSVPGIFVAGEAQDSHFRQAITTAGDGAKAAMEAIEYVERLEEVAPAVSETTSV
ncbi:MAG: thioredoxin-disulfide reductase [Chloroflexota bacterium]|nr:thioredoxin-disulfide reductase [Chloroflexota bacterium]MDP6758447.1 thioredoxin-disulfide reductase [Chloroflexota bacterium]